MGKQKVYFVKDETFDNANIAIGGIEEVNAHIESVMNESDEGDEIVFKVSFKYMTEEEIDSLPEWDG